MPMSCKGALLQKRLAQLDLEAKISALLPVVLGGLVVVPVGLLRKMGYVPSTAPLPGATDNQAIAARAAIVMEVERNLGFEPVDREADKLGYDIESRVPETGRLRFIEVKGRASGAETITVTRNEILYSLNKPDDYILAIVEFKEHGTHRVHYIRRPFQRNPDFGVTSVNYSPAELLAKAEPPVNESVFLGGYHDCPNAMSTAKNSLRWPSPSDVINQASAREKSIRHGHPSTLHLWWSREAPRGRPRRHLLRKW